MKKLLFAATLCLMTLVQAGMVEDVLSKIPSLCPPEKGKDFD